MRATARWVEGLKVFMGERFHENAALGSNTTYRVGGPARWLIKVANLEELLVVKKTLNDTHADVSVLVLGNGSNMLVSDKGFDGLVIKLCGSFEELSILTDGRVNLGAASLHPVVARKLVSTGLSGFEWAVGVPGSFGGAVRMNAGGHGSEVANTLVSVRVLDLWGESAPRTVLVENLDLSYRHSSLSDHEIVLDGQIQLECVSGVDVLKERLSNIVKWRREHQPGGQNAGSVFVNPDDGRKAAELIEELGLKGLRFGSAEVSTKHANFIQCDEGGRGDDVYQLMVEVKRRVRDSYGVELRSEIRLIGFEEAAL